MQHGSTRHIEEYAAFLRSFLNLDRPLRVVFDFSNGPAGLVVPTMVRGESKLTCTFVDRTLSGNFPGHGPNPLIGGGLFHLHHEVAARHADVGIIFDADADRAFVVDERGRWVPPHLVAHLLARTASGPIVLDTRTALALRYAGLASLDTAPSAPPGARSGVIISPVGSVYVKERMRAAKAGFGAEYSGHYYFAEFLSVDSGILASVKVLNALSHLPYSLAEFVDLAPREIHFEERNIPAARPASAVAALAKILRPGSRRTMPAARLTGIPDGTIIEANTWFATIRPSNTEPLVRVCVGSADPAVIAEKRAIITAASHAPAGSH